MPHQFVRLKIRLPRHLDRRYKLTDEQRAEIRSLAGTISKRKLAIMFKVSRRTISYVIEPELYTALLAKRNEGKLWLKYYDRDRHVAAVREHRRYKAKALKEANQP